MKLKLIFIVKSLFDYTCIKINNETINKYIEEIETKKINKNSKLTIITKDFNNKLKIKKFYKLETIYNSFEYIVDIIKSDSGSIIISYGEEDRKII